MLNAKILDVIYERTCTSQPEHVIWEHMLWWYPNITFGVVASACRTLAGRGVLARNNHSGYNWYSRIGTTPHRLDDLLKGINQ